MIMIVGASIISRHTQSYMSVSEVLIDPGFADNRSIDSHTHFEFLKFHALISGEFERAVQELDIQGNPVALVSMNHDAASGKISIGFRDRDPETALAMTAAVVRSFQLTAKKIELKNAEQRADYHKAEINMLHTELDRLKDLNSETYNRSKHQVTQDLYQTALDKLAKAQADLAMPTPDIVTVLRQPTLATAPSGPNKTSMYLALLSFAIFCALIAVLILEWLDTIIRRPHDIEHTLGLATFGVIPDLQLQPIDNIPNSKRDI